MKLINPKNSTKDKEEDQGPNMNFASPLPKKYQIHLASFSMVSPPAIEIRFEIIKLKQ